MHQYLDCLQYILDYGVFKPDRTGIGTKSVFGYQMRFNLQQGFPLLTTKKLHTRSIFHELIWFLSGETNIKYLQENGVTIWDEWADKDGNLGPIYGAQWRNYNNQNIDQIKNLIEGLITNPDSRRHLVIAWNPAQILNMKLPPCHVLFQFYVANHQISCQLYQRSCDFFLGVPFNIASYALLTHMVAQVVGLTVGEFIWCGGDVHLYSNHLDQAKIQIQRKPKPLPQIVLNPDIKSIFDFKYSDIEIKNYDPEPHIPAPIAI